MPQRMESFWPSSYFMTRVRFFIFLFLAMCRKTSAKSEVGRNFPTFFHKSKFVEVKGDAWCT